MGIGGQYLTHPKTFKLCRSEFYMPGLMSRMNADAWLKTRKKKRIDEVAQDKVTQRLASYEKPEIDPEIEKKLTQYVGRIVKKDKSSGILHMTPKVLYSFLEKRPANKECSK